MYATSTFPAPMIGNIEFAFFDCVHCASVHRFERPSRVWGTGDRVMAVFTLGLWAIAQMTFAKPAWRCSVCGSMPSG